MAVVNVACPHCGVETTATVNEKPSNIKVRRKWGATQALGSYTWVEAGCPEGHTFGVGYK